MHVLPQHLRMLGRLANMRLDRAKDVLLFYEDFDVDTFFRGDRRIRRALRKLRDKVRRGRPKVTGFYVWFDLLKRALELEGRRVHVNATRLARANPSFPVGLVGYPQLLDGWTLPNPAVVGPGMIDHPSISPRLMEDPRYKVYVTTCDWYHDMFVPTYGETCAHWHAGFDLSQWPDLRGASKDLDVLIYDKVRWHRERYEPELIAPIERLLKLRGLRYETVRYGRYDHEGYRSLLKRARAMIFLCEHETQGMAYQEAMASGLPILAWDPGVWVDPHATTYSATPIPACSVPFFSPICGERFKQAADFEPAFASFWQRLAEYDPRRYVREFLSMRESAQIYLALLERAARA